MPRTIRINNIAGLEAGISLLVFIFCVGSTHAQSSPESKYFDADGVRIHYVEQGKGDPIVLLHGNTGSIDQWLSSGVFDDLASDHHVIAYDSRGHGQSDKPREKSAYGTEMAKDIVRLLDHLEIDRAHILGYSMGARVAGGAMPHYQDRIQTLILGGFAPARDWSASSQESVESRANRILTNKPQSMLDRGLDFEAMASLILSFSELAVTDEELSNSTVPTLGIVGSEDRNLDRVRDLQEVISDFQLVVIQGATHSGDKGVYLRPEFVKEVRQFIAVHPIGG